MLKKIRSSLSIKIFTITTIMLTICCLITYLFISWFLPKTYLQQIDDSYIDFAKELTGELDNLTTEDASALLQVIMLDLEENILIHVFNEVGNEVDLFSFSPTNMSLNDFKGIHATPAYSFSLDGEARTYFILFAIDTKPINQAIEALENCLPLLLIVIVFISSVSALLYSLYITHPILSLSKTSHKMATLDFSEKSKINRSDEIGALSKNLNILSEELSNSLNDLQQANTTLISDIEKERVEEKKRVAFFTAVSHELKTPIAVIKGQLEGMLYRVGTYKDRDKYLMRSIEVIKNLEKTVQELLIISKMESPGYVPNYKIFSLSEVLLQRLHIHEDLFLKKQIQSMHTIHPNIYVKADQQFIIKVVDNLIINAINYSPPKNRVLINLIIENGEASVIIENTGIHIDNNEIPRIFEAFYCIETSHNRQTSGSGLGLYVVKTILEQHNAKYMIQNTPSGVSFKFSLQIHSK